MLLIARRDFTDLDVCPVELDTSSAGLHVHLWLPILRLHWAGLLLRLKSLCGVALVLFAWRGKLIRTLHAKRLNTQLVMSRVRFVAHAVLIYPENCVLQP